MTFEINHWYRQYEELKMKEAANKKGRVPSRVAKERAQLLENRLGKRMAALDEEEQITAKIPILKGGALILPIGLLQQAKGDVPNPSHDAEAKKKIEALAMKAVFNAERALGRIPKDVSNQRGIGYDIESTDKAGNLYFIEVKGRIEGANSVTLTFNELKRGLNSPKSFRLAITTISNDKATEPVYISGIDWGRPGFGDTSVTKNLNQLLEIARTPH